jgi:hypothetical protein
MKRSFAIPAFASTVAVAPSAAPSAAPAFSCPCGTCGTPFACPAAPAVGTQALPVPISVFTHAPSPPADSVPPAGLNEPPEIRQARNRSEYEKRLLRFWLTRINGIKAFHQQQHPGLGLVVLVGADFVGQKTGRGSLTPNLRLVLQLLEANFLVVYVKEHYTSQLCPRCFGRSEFVKRGNVRRKCCKGECARQGKPFCFHRDVGAAVHLPTIMCFMLTHNGERAAVYRFQNE